MGNAGIAGIYRMLSDTGGTTAEVGRVLNYPASGLRRGMGYFRTPALSAEGPTPPLLPEQPASDAYAQHIHPSLVEIEQVRIEQRGEDILPPPPAARSTSPSHRREIAGDASATSHIARHSIRPHWIATFQSLVVRIANNLSGRAELVNGGLLKIARVSIRSHAEDRGPGKKPQRFLPELQPQPDRRRMFRSLYNR